MKPIERKADAAFLEALKCVEFRVPAQGALTESAYLLGIATRYGLVGAAATQHLLLATADEEDEFRVARLARQWVEIVEEHLRQVMRAKIPFAVETRALDTIARLAYQPVEVVLKLYRYGCGLEQILIASADQLAEDYADALKKGCPWFRRRKNRQEFFTQAEESVHFALHFFDRRQADLEELPIIAMIGE